MTEASPASGASANSAPLHQSIPAKATTPASAKISNESASLSASGQKPVSGSSRNHNEPPSSDVYTFFAKQKTSLLAFFDRSKGSSREEAKAREEPQPEGAGSVDAAALPAAVASTASPSQKLTSAPPPACGGNTLKTFFSSLALPGVYSEADAVLEHHAARMGVAGPTEKPDAAVGNDKPVTAAAAATPPAQPHHVHQLRPTQFFVPTLCEVCRRAVLNTKVWPPPSSSSSTSTSATPSFFSKLLLSPTSSTEHSCSPSPSSSCPSTEKEEEAKRPVREPAASPAQQPFLGFGSDGYHCEVCDMALHRHCLKQLRETQACEVLAPTAHHMPEDKPAAEDASRERDAAGGSSSSSFSWDGAKSLLGTYLDPNGRSNSRKDANVKVVLSGVYALLDTVASRYPELSPLTFVKRRQAIQDLSQAHQALYAACTSSLLDTELFTSITWDAIEQRDGERIAGRANAPDEKKKTKNEEEEEDAAQLAAVSLRTREMRPVKMDASFFSQITSSLSGASGSSANAGADLNTFLPGFAKLRTEEVAGPGASFPVQLLLWRAVRYATAVYGEVYRRGSLSSTVSAALLFTVNRGSVDVTKEVNDAAVTSLLELPPASLRLSRWASQATEPSYILLVDHAVGHIVVAFRGTLNTFDIMTDLAAVGVPFCGGYAHQGAAHVVNAIFDQRSSQYAARARTRRAPVSSPASPSPASEGVEVRTETDSRGNVKMVLEPYSLQALETPDGLLDGLEQLALAHPRYTILITGHSLGGGVAVLFATRLHHDRVFPESLLRRVHVIAFAPMPSLSLPAASCFDAVSCERDDGGYNHVGATSVVSEPQQRDAAACAPKRTQEAQRNPQQPARDATEELPASPSPPAAAADSTTSPPEEIRQACFPVWNIVNGFDCVPRLQVNTIDRLLRQVVGPQIASGTSAASAQQQQQRPSSSRATEAMMRQRCRGEGRDSAWVEVSVDPGAEEMKDMSAKPESKGARDATPRTAPAASTTEFACATQQQQQQEQEHQCSSLSEKANGTAAPASSDGIDAEVGPRAPTAANSEAEKQSMRNEPAWASAVRAHLGVSDAEEKEVVVVSASMKEDDSSALPDAVAAAVAAVEASSGGAAASRGSHDLSHELHHPGRVLLLTTPWDTAQNRLVDVPRGHPVMHELFLMKFMLLQHAGDAYGGSLTEIHRRPL